MFMQNQWYAACWARDVGRLDKKSYPVTICNEDIVLYRTLDGTIAALQDRCPHRLLPLSEGFVERGQLRCGYHGLLFGEDGRCVEMPNQERIPASV